MFYVLHINFMYSTRYCVPWISMLRVVIKKLSV